MTSRLETVLVVGEADTSKLQNCNLVKFSHFSEYVEPVLKGKLKPVLAIIGAAVDDFHARSHILLLFALGIRRLVISGSQVQKSSLEKYLQMVGFDPDRVAFVLTPDNVVLEGLAECRDDKPEEGNHGGYGARYNNPEFYVRLSAAQKSAGIVAQELLYGTDSRSIFYSDSIFLTEEHKIGAEVLKAKLFPKV